MKERLKKLAKTLFYRAYFLYASVEIRCRYFYEHRYGQLQYLSKEDYKIWRRAMLDLMKENFLHDHGFTSRIVYQTFAKAKIETVRWSSPEGLTTPIVALCVKNDRQRLQMLVEHYRTLGVERFAFVDNGSTDGTWEWMLEQPDIDLFRTEEQYNCFAKEGWLDRVVSHYGFYRWYVLTDSDELMTYLGMEEHPIRDLVACAEAAGVTRVKGLNMDMYSDHPLYSVSSEKVDLRQTYCWMDSDSYVPTPRKVAGSTITAVVGGPRLRVMGIGCSVMKYPLVYFTPGTVTVDAHFQFPYTQIEASPLWIGILHYKFLDIDKKENERRAKLYQEFSTGLNRSANYYSRYVEAATGNVTFMYDGSVRFRSSQSLKEIPLIQPVPFGQIRPSADGALSKGEDGDA